MILNRYFSDLNQPQHEHATLHVSSSTAKLVSSHDCCSKGLNGCRALKLNFVVPLYPKQNIDSNVKIKYVPKMGLGEKHPPDVFVDVFSEHAQQSLTSTSHHE